jgi:hypothetical protein
MRRYPPSGQRSGLGGLRKQQYWGTIQFEVFREQPKLFCVAKR